MPIYIYRAKKGPVEIISGQIEASSQDHAVDKLNEMGVVPISVAEEQGVDIEGFTAEKQKAAANYYTMIKPELVWAKTQDIDIFTRQLASLIKTNVPILKALSLISQQSANATLKVVVGELERQISGGEMLSEAIAKYPRIFNNLYVNMVRSGEKSGALAKVLNNMAEYREKEQDIKHKIQAALAYPALISIVGIGTVFVMLAFFLPKFTGLFASMGQAMPLSTRILIVTSAFMARNWYIFLLALIFIIVIFGRVRPAGKKKFLFDFIQLHLPFIKRFVRYADVARFARTLGMFIENGISVCDGLELAADVLDNDVLKERLKQARLDVVGEGCALSTSFKKIGVFPDFVVSMISVGEEGGRLQDSLAEIAYVYEREVEQAIKIMTSLLEPMLILAVGAVVGFIVFAMLSPIFNIGMVVR